MINASFLHLGCSLGAESDIPEFVHYCLVLTCSLEQASAYGCALLSSSPSFTLDAARNYFWVLTVASSDSSDQKS